MVAAKTVAEVVHTALFSTKATDAPPAGGRGGFGGALSPSRLREGLGVGAAWGGFLDRTDACEAAHPAAANVLRT